MLLTPLLTQLIIYLMPRAYILLFIFLSFIYDFVNYDFVNLIFKLTSNQTVCTPKLELPNLNVCDTLLMSTIGILIIHLLCKYLIYYTKTFRCVRFSNNLSTLNKKSLIQIKFSATLVTHLLCLIILSRSFESFVLLIPTVFEIDTSRVNIMLYICKKILAITYRCMAFHNFTLNFTLKIILYLIVLFKRSLYLLHTFLLWVILLTIILSNDVEKNPGDFTNGFQFL